MTDKKELKRRYHLDAPGRAGVYAIRHRDSGRTLLGAGLDAQGALNRHLFELRLNTHRNRALQLEWKRDGEAAFEAEVLDLVTPREDPAFDLRRELDTLSGLWREELGLPQAGDYTLPVSKG